MIICDHLCVKKLVSFVCVLIIKFDLLYCLWLKIRIIIREKLAQMITFTKLFLGEYMKNNSFHMRNE